MIGRKVSEYFRCDEDFVQMRDALSSQKAIIGGMRRGLESTNSASVLDVLGPKGISHPPPGTIPCNSCAGSLCGIECKGYSAFPSIYQPCIQNPTGTWDVMGDIQFMHNYRYNFRIGASWESGLKIYLSDGSMPRALARCKDLGIADSVLMSGSLACIRFVFGKVVNQIKPNPFMLSIPSIEDESVELERSQRRREEKERKRAAAEKEAEELVPIQIKRARYSGWDTNPDYNNLVYIPPFDRNNFSPAVRDLLRI